MKNLPPEDEDGEAGDLAKKKEEGQEPSDELQDAKFETNYSENRKGKRRQKGKDKQLQTTGEEKVFEDY